MDNSKRYLDIFVETFEIKQGEAAGLKYQDIQAWDSVGHMNLISSLEHEFDLMMDTEDIIDFDSFEKGKEILSTKYGIVF